MIVVDVETGGLNPKENPMLSIGAVNESGKIFYTEIKPTYGTLNEQALEINDYNPTTWRNYDLKEELKTFFEWCNNDTLLAGHNPSFDLGYIQESSKIVGLKCPFGYRTVDLHTASYLFCIKNNISFEKLTSDEIYKLLGMKQEPRPHNALNGALWEKKAFNIIESSLNGTFNWDINKELDSIIV